MAIEYKIFELLKLKNYVTSEKIAFNLNVSKRTVKSHIKSLNSELKKNGAEIISKPQYGYILKIYDDEKFKIYAEYVRDRKKVCPIINEERVYFLIEFLIDQNKYIKIEDLEEVLYISRTIISSNLKKVKQYLNHFDLKLETLSKSGIKISGDEFNKRNCLTYYRLSGRKGNANYKISNILLNNIIKHNLHYTSENIERIKEYLYISIKRISNDMQIDELEDKFKNFNTKDIDNSVNQILCDIKKELNLSISFNNNEKKCFAILLKSLAMIEKNNDKEGNHIITSSHLQIANEILLNIDKAFSVSLTQDFELLTNLSKHLVALNDRAKFCLWDINPMTKAIMKQYPIAALLAKQAVLVLNREYKKELPNSELSFLVLYFALALEKGKASYKRLDVLLVCGSGNATTQMLKYKLNERFNNEFNYIHTVSVIELKKMNLMKYDLIISTVQIPFQINKDILYIDLKDFDYDCNEIAVNLNIKKVDSLMKFFPEHLFFPNEELKDKKSVIEFISEKINKYETVEEGLRESILERERYGSTEQENFVAIPHPVNQLAKRTFVCILLLKKPIIWNVNKVQFIITFMIEKNSKENLQELCAVVSDLISNKKYITDLLKDRNYGTFKEIIEICIRGNIKHENFVSV